MWGILGALIIAVLTIIALLIVGQLLYRKSSKLAYTIWALTLVLFIYLIYSFNTANTRMGDLSKNEYIGTYKIAYASSSYDSIDLNNYKDLLLIVKADNTFEFSRQVPFFSACKGYWQHMDDGDISWTEISVGDKNLMQANVEVDKWIFSGHALTNGKNKNLIIFVRQ